MGCGILETLKVLMWKHLVVRVKRFIHTPVELLSVLIYFLFLYLCKDFIIAKPSANVLRTEVYSSDPYPLNKNDFSSLILVLYSPDTKETRQLMDKVGPKLDLTWSNNTSGASVNAKKYIGVKNVSSVNEVLDVMKKSMTKTNYWSFDPYAVVIFENVEEFQSDLRYTIKMDVNFMIEDYKSQDNVVRSHSSYGEDYYQFMRLQWAIDSSYLELQGAENDVSKLNVTMQEFPFVNSVKNASAVLIGAIVYFMCFISLTLPFIFFMTRLLEERSTGVQELIKMVGVSTNVLNISHFLNVLPTGLVFCISGTIFLTVGSNALIPLTNPLLIFIMLLLYFTSIMTLAVTCCYITDSAQYATSLSTLCYIGLWMPSRFLMDTKVENAVLRYLSGIFPHVPMHMFWSEVSYMEEYGKGIGFKDVFKPHGIKSVPVMYCYVMFIVQTSIYSFLAWYLSKVRPGRYGAALPWSFLFKPQYWSKKKVTPHPELKDSEEVPMSESRDPLYFEKPPATADVGIRISNVTKVYNKQKALDNVSFDVLKGEITVLLGHNGAGKTTLMAIITGMTSATEGTVTVNGLDTVQHQQEVRKQLGLCPQHNIFFPDLTVKQHLMFFAMLKGQSYKSAKLSSIELLERLKLDHKADERSNQLSGGMKRRLQLACALAGGGDVLILDEPTSGLDVETRRELWNLLLSLRGERTVLLTTHFMEEADALGDRVAALHGGRIRAVATPIYLKKNMGTGYRLSLTTIGLPKEEPISRLVNRYVPNAVLKEKGLNTMEYSLPSASSQNFPQLFTKLEEHRSELGIDSIGVGVSTLEEVFLKLCSDIDTKFSEDAVDGHLLREQTSPRLTGFRLVCSQIPALMTRHLHYLYYKKWSFLFLQLLIPIFLTFMFTYATNNERSSENQTLSRRSMDMSIYKNMHEPTVLYKLDNYDVNALRTSGYIDQVEFQETANVTDAVLRAGSRDAIEYSKYVAGLELLGDTATVYYTTTVRHAAPVALNMLSNVLSSRIGRTITTYNEPYQSQNRTVTAVKSAFTTSVWGFFMLFIILTTTTNCVSLLIKDRRSGTRHIHIMAGCSPVVHWMVTFVTHAVIYTIVSVIPSVIAAATMDMDKTFDNASFLLFAFVSLELAVISFLAFTYLVSFGFGERAAMSLLSVIILVGGLIPAYVRIISESTNEKISFGWKIPLVITQFLIPPHEALMAIYLGGKSAEKNAQCNVLLHLCEKKNLLTEEFKKCCDSNGKLACYFCMGDDRPGASMLILVIQTILYMILVILAQDGYLNYLQNKLFNCKYKKPETRFNDNMVRAEKTYVSKAIGLPVEQIPDAMLVDDLHINYTSIGFGRINKCNAVKGISFSVKKGECFGLLGVNGAGKSSTFRALTGERCATRGQIYANGHFLRRPRKHYLQSLGYCSQFFGLDEFMTGRANLRLLLKLRGVTGSAVDEEVNSWIQVVGLEQYAKELVSSYSGGCRRRLASAAALSQGADVTLLDEPTAGVDVSARRRVWSALRRGLAEGRAVIITSHSLDEMEALCKRIAIMSGGELGALGSAAALRADHAAGHAVRLKLRSTDDEVDGASLSTLNSLKETVMRQFNCTLKDEHKTMLHYHINETMRYSDLFAALEGLKAKYPNLIEDYSATETTLEEVFLSFAQESQDSDRPTAV